MEKRFRCGADAGNISVLDSAYILENHGILDGPDTRKIRVEPGIYDVEISIHNTYNGPVRVDARIQVRGKYLIVGDACYSWSYGRTGPDAWPVFLNMTSYLENHASRGITANTGGDGGFSVVVKWEKVEEKVPSVS